LLGLWVIVVGIEAVGFTMNLWANASLESSAALIVFLAFITVWAFLVLRVLWASFSGGPAERAAGPLRTIATLDVTHQ